MAGPLSLYTLHMYTSMAMYIHVHVHVHVNLSMKSIRCTSSPKLYCLALSIPTRVEYMVVFSVRVVALSTKEGRWREGEREGR